MKRRASSLDQEPIVDPTPYYEGLQLRFGIPPDSFKAYRLIRNGRRLISIVNKDHQPPLRPKPDIVGMPFLRLNSVIPKLTTGAAMTFGHLATQNVVNLDDRQARNYLRRQDMTLPPQQCHLVTGRGHILIQWKGTTLGMGIIRNPEQRLLESEYPKGWLLKESS